MAGRPFEVGRFAHTLRVRLMREHVGIDVDALSDEDYTSHEEESYGEPLQEKWDPNAGEKSPRRQNAEVVHGQPVHDSLSSVAQETREMNLVQRKRGHRSRRILRYAHLDEGNPVGFTSAGIPTVETKDSKDRPTALKTEETSNDDQLNSHQDRKLDSHAFDARAAGWEVVDGAPQGAYDPPHSASDHGDSAEDKSTTYKGFNRRKHKGKTPVLVLAPHIHPDDFEDPVSDQFWEDVWVACAEHNTDIYRKVFHVIPDDTVMTWKRYKHFIAHHERFAKTTKTSVPSSSGDSEHGSNPLGESVEELHYQHEKDSDWSLPTTVPKSQHTQEKDIGRGKSVRGSRPFDKGELGEMENLLKQIRGHLVLHPTHFLEDEDEGENFLFNADKLMPLPIYD
ncbi:hypothetical protein JVU11DRAFT_3592 [Chiua virens]|nr:hypothetical protein JVU11DRAFT_3592 [Chiua virens]